jgi:AbrB family looped-hinge helix DNA binding protein
LEFFALLLLVRKFLHLYGDVMVEASTTKVSSKGQVVIPANVRKAASLKKGEKILAIAIDDTVVLKKIVDKSFEETMKPVWSRVRKLGLAEEDIDALVEEARSQSSP